MPFWGTFTVTFGAGRRLARRIVDFLLPITRGIFVLNPDEFSQRGFFFTTNPKETNDIRRRIEYFGSGEITASASLGSNPFSASFTGPPIPITFAPIEDQYEFPVTPDPEAGGFFEGSGGIISITASENREEITFTSAAVINNSGSDPGIEAVYFNSSAERDEFLSVVTAASGAITFKITEDTSNQTYYIRSTTVPDAFGGDPQAIFWNNGFPGSRPELDQGENLMVNGDFSGSTLLEGWTVFPSINDISVTDFDDDIFYAGMVDIRGTNGLPLTYMEQEISVQPNNHYLLSYFVQSASVSGDPDANMRLEIFDVNDGNNLVYSDSIGNGIFNEIFGDRFFVQGDLLKVRLTFTESQMILGKFGIMQLGPYKSGFQATLGTVSIYRDFQPRYIGFGVVNAVRDPEADPFEGTPGVVTLTFDSEANANTFAASVSGLAQSVLDLTVARSESSTRIFIQDSVNDAYSYAVDFSDLANVSATGTTVVLPYTFDNFWGNIASEYWQLEIYVEYIEPTPISVSVDTNSNSTTVTLNSAVAETLATELLVGGGAFIDNGNILRLLTILGTLTDIDGTPINAERFVDFAGIYNLQGSGNTLTFNWANFQEFEPFQPDGRGLIVVR